MLPTRQRRRAIIRRLELRSTAAMRRAQVALATLKGSFRRSLQLRMVSITLVLSTVLIAIFGWIVVSHITSGLVNARVNDAQARIAYGRSVVENKLSTFTGPSDPALPTNIFSVLSDLQTRAPASADGAVVVLLGDQAGNEFASPSYTSAPQVIPAELRRVVGDQNKVAHQVVRLAPDGHTTRLYLVTGTPVQSTVGDTKFELYYLDPLTNEEASANLVSRTVIITGIVLSILVSAVAGLVTRLVVNPVRVAARTAQRLSAGLLDQRVPVRGEDDLAHLGAAFNQMAANLQRQIGRLEEMSRLQRRFTSDVSHELRTPLTTVRMAADLIFSERDQFEPAVARSAELLQAELDRFEELLTDLLEISRFDAGFAALDAEPTDIVPLVERVVERLSPLAEREGVQIDLVLPEPPVIAEIDPRRVERVLRNLVGNAVEHAEGQPVRIAVAIDDGGVAVTVRDHGIGLRAGEEKLVFNRFWRADPSRARQTGGSGLGLSISIEDARLHGGWLEAWGAPGQGALFRLTLPIRAGDRLLSSPLPLTPIDARIGTVLQPPLTRAEPDGARTLAGILVAQPRIDAVAQPRIDAVAQPRQETGPEPDSQQGSEETIHA